jgi:hypothetical protein
MIQLNQTFINQADQILTTYYPGCGSSGMIPNNSDPIAHYFVSPIIELMFRHVMFFYLAHYFQNQANFFQTYAPEMSYYMTEEWMLNRFMFTHMNPYGLARLNDIYYLDPNYVEVGEKYGVFIVTQVYKDAYNGVSGPRFLPLIKNKTWIDYRHKCRNDNSTIRFIDLMPSRKGYDIYHQWLNQTVIQLYNRAVDATVFL